MMEEKQADLQIKNKGITQLNTLENGQTNYDSLLNGKIYNLTGNNQVQLPENNAQKKVSIKGYGKGQKSQNQNQNQQSLFQGGINEIQQDPNTSDIYQELKQKQKQIYVLVKNQFKNIMDKRATWRIFYKYAKIICIYALDQSQWKNLTNIPYQFLKNTFYLKLSYIDVGDQFLEVFKQLNTIFFNFRNLKKLSLTVFNQSSRDQQYSQLISLIPSQLEILEINTSRNIEYIEQALQYQTGLQQIKYTQSLSLNSVLDLRNILQSKQCYKNLKSIIIDLDLFQYTMEQIQNHWNNLQQFLKEFDQIKEVKFCIIYRICSINEQVLEVLKFFGEINNSIEFQLKLDINLQIKKNIHLLQNFFQNLDKLEYIELELQLKNSEISDNELQYIDGLQVPQQLRQPEFVYIMNGIKHSLNNLKQFKLIIQQEYMVSIFAAKRMLDVTDIEIEFFNDYLKVLPKLEEFYLNNQQMNIAALN